MEFNEMLNNVLYVVLTAILPILATYAVNFIKTKITATKNEDMSNLVKDALNDVMDAVLYINVEAMNMISDGAKKAIEEMYGSFDKWLQLKIESSVNMAKKQ